MGEIGAESQRGLNLGLGLYSMGHGEAQRFCETLSELRFIYISDSQSVFPGQQHGHHLVSNADYQAPPRPAESETLRVGPH